MSRYVPPHLCESARPGQIAKVMEWGFTLRQARFLGYRGFTSAQIRTALGFDTQLDSYIEDT